MTYFCYLRCQLQKTVQIISLRSILLAKCYKIVLAHVVLGLQRSKYTRIGHRRL